MLKIERSTGFMGDETSNYNVTGDLKNITLAKLKELVKSAHCGNGTIRLYLNDEVVFQVGFDNGYEDPTFNNDEEVPHGLYFIHGYANGGWGQLNFNMLVEEESK